MRHIAAATALGLAALFCTALAYAALYPQTGSQGPRSATLTPGTAELLEDLGGPGVLSGDFWSSTTGGTTHAGYGVDFRSYHYHGEALDLRVDKSLWDVLYGAMGRADYGLVELYGPWGLYKNGEWLDPATHRVWRAQTPIELTPRQFSLLEFLLRRSGEVLSKIEILNHVWDFAFDGDSNVVEVYIRYLREKVDRPFGRDSIQTVRGVGYRLRPGEGE